VARSRDRLTVWIALMRSHECLWIDRPQAQQTFARVSEKD
jgi:hypothetical protein